MILRCIQNDPSALAPEQLRVAAKYQTVYPLSIGAEYRIAGMVLYASVLYLLVEDDEGSPLMAPTAMFSTEMVQLPGSWMFQIRDRRGSAVSDGYGDETIAIWGYAELVEDEDHFQMLAEWNPKALEVFRGRMASM